MLSHIIKFSLNNKLIILLFSLAIVATGIYSLMNIAIGAVPDITNNQVQVITTSRDLSTQDVEKFITYPIELEMANLPGVKEIRSISKFGLSVVTIVFDDRLGTYLPRQLIAEKIKTASENIPDGFGTPFMGPISTGLGEIYQYVLEIDPAYRSQYSTMDLRTIQDWIVRRQLSGIPGVVEVNTWGGYLKQYEVSISPEKLRAMNISITEVFDALESNNSVAGGGYIERDNQAYFIRGEGLTQNISDIENIVVVNRSGLSIYIKDLATVSMGHATRFGAITGNGEGEKVLGQVMMLKDANSKAVIDAVKERVAEIENTLPAGITINPFLERSELIEKTTFTITENLVLGCLIVVFVVVLLLGNWRTGLVVASVIPLSLLFALSLMYLFGVDANLMSLGAIDFGIIIDGAVIIVEYIAYKITTEQSRLVGVDLKERNSLIDTITYNSTHKMMHSAVFGQLIIIIVFIPILSLVNVEGKMFRPMALTFSFALVGAMILCFTYVPVISSLFLKPTNENPKSVTNRLIHWIKSLYQPSLELALEYRKTVLTTAVALLIGSIILFNSLGGEFVPTLDEGDFVIQPVLPTGTSLTKTVEITTQIERVIKQFPEVDQIVTRIGAAEVPTDPMSMEETDVIITLHPIDQWTSAESKDELANLIKESLVASIPEVDYEFTQPIEMRFNELITGVRADLAIKIFGEDLSILSQKAAEIEQLIASVEGASDITVEKIEGLPQMSVTYDRAKIARFGLNISDVNEVISMGFAGKVAGTVFEGERRFDLVVRYQQDFRQNLDNLKNAYVTNAAGMQIPLNELAIINYTTGPAKISRDDTKRRIVVSVNVRNRDLESVVQDVESLISQNIQLPAGYHITYGGQFENLESARQRLMIALPVALLLIFIMLYFAFQSVRDALLIYSAIPLSAVGGIIFLWIRGLPFSISAGVGFIALFGIAVLNGIVLIEHYKEMQRETFDSFRQLIIEGTIQRLRPVLLTASAAALGFLPMAISTSAGAEVQRPLASVVIGGLISATFLTLVVLPALYYSVNKKKSSVKLNPKIALVLFLLIPWSGWAQTATLNLEEAITIAKENNAFLKSMKLTIEKEEALKRTAFTIDKTQLYYSYDENNIAPNNLPLKVWGIQQQFEFPTVYAKQSQLNQSRINREQQRFLIEDQLLEKQVKSAYYHTLYLQNLQRIYQFLDSAYSGFSEAADRRFELGESNILEQLTAKTKLNSIKLLLDQTSRELDKSYLELKKYLQLNNDFTVADITLQQIPLSVADTLEHPVIQLMENELMISQQQSSLLKSKRLPDLGLEYFQGTNNGLSNQNYQGFQVGMSVPLFIGSYQSAVKSNLIQEQIQIEQLRDYKLKMTTQINQLKLDLQKAQEALNYYEKDGQVLSNALLLAANRSFNAGEIDFFQYIQSLDRATQLQIDQLFQLNQYNQTAISIQYVLY